MDKLRQILETKRGEVEKIRPQVKFLQREALARNDFRSFHLGIAQGENQLGLIAEVKRASPSAGVIREDFDAVAIARAYEAAGAHALSVLTDEVYFQGRLSYLREIREAVRLPLLRKDFIIDEAQIYEAVCAGADAVLLIVAALEQERLVDLLAVAHGCQLDVLVEVHDADELERALDTEARIIGVNNRNLRSFVVDLATTERLSEEVPDGLVLVSESGIRTGADAQRMFDCGVNALLVGEALMRKGEEALPAAVAELLGVRRSLPEIEE